MPVFWMKNRGLRWHPSNPAFDGSPRPFSLDESCTPAGTALEERDWEQIDELLARQSPPLISNAKEGFSGTLVSSLRQLRDLSLTNQVLPAGSTVDALLDLWALVHEIDPRAAQPVESLLTTLVGRDLVSAHEVALACDEIETALQSEVGLTADDGPDSRAPEGAVALATPLRREHDER